VKLYDLCRRLQPDVIVNNRVDKGRGGMAGMTSDERYAGDFGTPEQEIPPTGLPGVDWETCMTMNRHWGYNKHDQNWKSTEDLVRKLVDIASKGGNFLLNVGPTAEGRFPEASIQRLEEIGRWMDGNAESIHGTSASPFASLPWGRCTMKRIGGRTWLYLHVFDWPADGKLVVPELGNEPASAHLLVRPKGELIARQEGGRVVIDVPPTAIDPIDTVVVLELAEAPIVYETPRIEAEADLLLDSLDVALAVRSAGLDVRYTLDGTEPTATSPRYEEPLRLTETTTVKARSFHGDRPVAELAERTFQQTYAWPNMPSVDLEPGLVVELFRGTWDVLPDFGDLEREDTWVAETIGVKPGANEEYYGLRLRGFLEVPETALYAFRLTSDDGSRLWIDGREVIDHDGLHGAESKRGVAPLTRGHHAIEIRWFNKTASAALDLEMAKVGEELARIEPRALAHR
jgi:alpha-L-fucosidase